MTHTQFDLYVTALLKSIWQGEEKAPDCLGVKVEEAVWGAKRIIRQISIFSPPEV